MKMEEVVAHLRVAHAALEDEAFYDQYVLDRITESGARTRSQTRRVVENIYAREFWCGAAELGTLIDEPRNDYGREVFMRIKHACLRYLKEE